MAEEQRKQTAPPSEDLSSRVQQLEAALKAQRAAMPQSLIPLHGAGEGDDVADTWSQYEQEAARAE